MAGLRQPISPIHRIGRSFALLTLGLGPQLIVAAATTGAVASESKTIVFVCLHGSVKSQMAAAHFNKIASERSLPYTAISRGVDVDNSIPTRIRDGLSLDGLTPLDDQPIQRGDFVEITVENVAGTKTIVGLKKL